MMMTTTTKTSIIPYGVDDVDDGVDDVVVNGDCTHSLTHFGVNLVIGSGSGIKCAFNIDIIKS